MRPRAIQRDVRGLLQPDLVQRCGYVIITHHLPLSLTAILDFVHSGLANFDAMKVIFRDAGLTASIG